MRAKPPSLAAGTTLSLLRGAARNGNSVGRGPIASLALLVPLLLAVVLFLRPGTAEAQIGSGRYSSIIIDAGTGRVLEAVSPDEVRYPASLTKMMTIYMLSEALRDQRVKLDQLVPISDHAASMFPSKLRFVPTSRITPQHA